MSEHLPPCPHCGSVYTDDMGALLVCHQCAHEWSASEADDAAAGTDPLIRDVVGNALRDGDTVTVIKDLEIKGSSSVVKVGTRVKNIRHVNCVGDHNIDCKVDCIGPMQLKDCSPLPLNAKRGLSDPLARQVSGDDNAACSGISGMVNSVAGSPGSSTAFAVKCRWASV